MNIFKKLFRSKKAKEDKKSECWYNNYHEEKKKRRGEVVEGAALSGPNQIDYSIAQYLSKS